MDHFHKSDQECLLSWENSRKDSPVIDLVQFYKCVYFDLNFEVLFQEYLKVCSWSEEEKKLFFVVISIPPKFDEKGPQFEVVKHVRETFDYVYKTEQLIRPYYATEQK